MTSNNNNIRMRYYYNIPSCVTLLAIVYITSTHSFYTHTSFSTRTSSSLKILSSKNISVKYATKIPEISNWKILPTGSVSGIVEKHSVIEDGDVITTSTLVDPKSCREGRIVTTTTGSKYKLKNGLLNNSNNGVAEEVVVPSETNWIDTSRIKLNYNNGQQPSSSSSLLPQITNWEVLASGKVVGTVKNHPMYGDGEFITTSSIQQDAAFCVEGSIVSTKSGSKYKLLKPSIELDYVTDTSRSSIIVEKKKTQKKASSPSSPGGFFEKFIQQESKRLQDSLSPLLPTVNIKNQAPKGSGTQEMLSSSSNSRARTSDINNMLIPEISNWKVLPSGAVVGIVNKHPVIDDGDIITTSVLVDPLNCVEEMIVATKTGSQYKLKSGFELFNTVNSVLQTQSQQSRNKANKKKLKTQIQTQSQQQGTNIVPQTEYEGLVLTEQTVGEGKYVLVNYPKRSTSGKSLIYTSFRTDKEGLPTGKRLVVKLTPNENALQREYQNYKHVTSSGFVRGKFVQIFDFYPIADTKYFTTQSALVIEGGLKDLKQLLNDRWRQGLEGQAMRDVAYIAGQCIQAMHSSKMVWTDLKTENFVIMEEEDGFSGLKSVKGIDLESARPFSSSPVDYSPEACPPEFADAFVNGYGADFILKPSYDMWSLGMMLYELSTGTPYFENKSPVTITKILPSEGFKIDVEKVKDDKLRSLIQQCLNINPKKRPDINRFFLHPFFTTTGIGPFSFIR